MRSSSHHRNMPPVFISHLSFHYFVFLWGYFSSYVAHADSFLYLMLLYVRPHSICMMMLLWYRLVSKSEPWHKLAVLPAFKENTLINFHWLWNAGSLSEFCGRSGWVSFLLFLISKENGCRQRECIVDSQCLLVLLFPFPCLMQLNNSQHFYSVLYRMRCSYYKNWTEA